MRNEVNRLLRSIDEITDKDISLIEDREKRLRELLDETDRRLALLHRELDRRSAAEKTYREMGSLALNQPPAAADNAEKKAAAPAISAAVNPAQTAEASGPAGPEPVQPVEERIRELAAAGFSANVIASRLGVSLSEAELAVTLHSRHNQ